MIDRLFVIAVLIGMVGSLGLLIEVCVVSLVLPLLPLLLLSCLLSVVALAIYMVSDGAAFRRNSMLRWAAYIGIAVCMLPSMIPSGVLVGDLIVATGAWNDPPGSHADLDVLGPLGLGILGLLAGPLLSVWAVRAVARRMEFASLRT